MDGTQIVEDPQRPAQLHDDLPGLLRGEQRLPQEKVQGISLHELLQNEIFAVSLRHFKDVRQIGTGAAQQLPVDLRVSGELPQDKLLPRGFVPDETDAAPGTLLQQPDFLVLLPQNIG